MAEIFNICRGFLLLYSFDPEAKLQLCVIPTPFRGKGGGGWEVQGWSVVAVADFMYMLLERELTRWRPPGVRQQTNSTTRLFSRFTAIINNSY